MTTLKDVVDQLKKNNEKSEDISSGVKTLIEMQTRNKLDDLEKQREAKSQAKVMKNIQKPKTEVNNNYGFLGLAALPGLLTPILAGATALSAAFVGLRGWEIPVIKSVTVGIKSLASSIPEGIIRLRDAALIKLFGFRDPSQIRIDPNTGKFAKGLTIQQQISDRMLSLRKSFLSYFGLGVDGSPIQKMKNGKFAGISTIGKLIEKSRESIMSFVKPVTTVLSKISTFAGGTLTKFIDVLKPMASSVGMFARVVGKVLKPLGIIFSAYEGIVAAFDEEGPLINKITAGISAFTGDFIGSFLDLLKDGVSLIFEKIGFVDLSKSIDEFSFEEAITDGLKTTLNWFVKLFDDPTKALNTAWNGFLSMLPSSPKTFFDILWMPFNKTVDWITKKLEWREDEAPTFNLYDIIKESFDTVDSFISNIPNILKGMLVDVIADIKISFVRFGGWLSSIIPMIQFEGMKAIQALPLVGNMVSDAAISQAHGDVRAAQAGSNTSITRIEAARKNGHDRIKFEMENKRKQEADRQKREEIIRSSNTAQQVIDARSQNTNNSKTINLVGSTRPVSTDGPGGFY